MTPQELDRSLEHTLHALDEARPSAGFSDRLEAALQDRLTRVTAPPPSPLQMFQPMRLGLAFGSVMFVGMLLVVYWRSAQQPTSPTRALATTTEAQARSAQRPLTPMQPAAVRGAAAPLSGPSGPAGIRISSVRAVAALTLTLQAPPSSAADAQALADLHTTSFPAPPLPPTAQERLVRLMLRHGEKHDLAQLDPARTSDSAQRDGTAFREFFDPTPTHASDAAPPLPPPPPPGSTELPTEPGSPLTPSTSTQGVPQ